MKYLDKQAKALIVCAISLCILCIVSVSYGYFSTVIKSDVKPLELIMGTMKLRFDDSTNSVVLNNAFPGDSVTKKFNVTNIGTLETNYNIKVFDVTNTFIDKEDLIYTLTKDEEEISKDQVVPDRNGYIHITQNIKPNEEHNYKLTITFKQTNEDQNDNQKKKLELRVEVDTKEEVSLYEYKEPYKDKSGANPPELYQGLIPIKYEEDGTIKYADIENDNWYDYDNHEWANAVLLDNNQIKDKSNKHHNATLIDGELKNGEAILDDKTDMIDCGYANYNFESSFSTVVRFKLNAESMQNKYIIGNAESAGMYLFVGSSKKLRAGVYDGISYKYTSDSQTILELNNYYEVAMVFDGNTIKIYLNGNLLNEMTYNFDSKATMKSSSMPFYLGANPNSNGHDSEANITINKAMVYNDVLTEDEITKIYQNQEINKDTLLFDLDFNNKVTPEYNIGDIININDISQMYVWIPRYKYQLFNVNNESKPEQMINVVFENGTQNTGTVSCEYINHKNGEIEEKCVDAENGNWYTHPAFTFGSMDLRGIWVGKFTTSGQVNNLNIKPNVSPFYSNVFSLFNASRNIELQYASRYNIDSNEIDTHMMKNIEWGAVAYLTQSQYGRCTDGNCTEVWANSNSNSITGCGGDSVNATPSTVCNDWLSANGKHASTTDNQYGVYDMSGVSSTSMGNMVDTKGEFAPAVSGFTSAPHDKYYDKYSYNTLGPTHERGHLGDATREVVKRYRDVEGGWYDDMINLPFNNNNYPNVNWFARGKSSRENRAGDGIYAVWARTGSTTGMRVVLTAQDGNS